jgi:hypothetical protein
MLPDLDQIDEQQFKALTGLTRTAFYQLLPLFSQSYIELAFRTLP